MEFSIATLLSSFPDDKSIAPKALEKKLECEEESELQKLQIALDALEKLGLVSKDRGRYRRNDPDEWVEARLRCSSKGFCFAIQDEEGADDIYVRESYLSNAWNGDRVLVKVIKEGSRRRSPEGEVKLILERANPSVLARIKEVPDDGYRAVPLDDRLLFEIELESQPNFKDILDYLVHVEVKRYPLGAKPPLGEVAQVLGSDAETANDIDIVCCKHDLPRKFSAKVERALSQMGDRLAQVDTANRLDLRQLPTFTLSPANPTPDNPAISVDRAFSLTPGDVAGQWQLAVHLADVAAYIPQESTIDREAQRRGTAIFLGDLIIPMLPEPVIQALNLTPGNDRLAISLVFAIDTNGDVLDYEIQPTVIRVDTSLTYESAEVFFTEKKGEVVANPKGQLKGQPIWIAETISVLWSITNALRDQRYERGSFDLALPETHAHFDDETQLGAMVTAPLSAAQTMISEVVLLVNQSMGEHLHSLGIPVLHSVQPAVDPADAIEAIKLVANMGIELALEDDEEVYPSDFKTFTDRFAESEHEKILSYLLEAILKPTHYSPEVSQHFGLALDEGYIHASSPLQRYSDMLTQYFLHAVFEHGRDRRTTRTKEGVNLRHSSCQGKINWNVLPPEIHSEFEHLVNLLAIPMTERENLAHEAESDLSGLQKAGMMKERTGEIFTGLITGVQSYGFFVEIESGKDGPAPSRLEGLVHVSSLKDDWYEYRSRQQTLVGRKSRKQYGLGGRVDVQVKSVDYYRQQIDLAPVHSVQESEPHESYNPDDSLDEMMDE
jgi:ribonuclease R